MVKGISRQVIVVHSPDPKLFEQAIFILKDEAVSEGVTEEALLKEAENAARDGGSPRRKRHLIYYGAFWAVLGAAVMGAVWLAAAFIF